MKTIRTVVTVEEDLRHLRLKTPLPVRPAGECEIELRIPDDEPVFARGRAVEFSEAIGLLGRLFPDAPYIGTDEYMRTIREGDTD
jgi:hypothetical protein